jgi:peroxiredoxin
MFKRLLTISFLILAASVSLFAQQSLSPGQPAPDFSVSSLDGKPFTLSSLQGKVVVLTFWSTRCEICRSEIPKLNRLVEQYRGKDVVFLALTMENGARVEPFLRRNTFNYTIVPDGLGVILKYANISPDGTINMGYPSYFLINQKGIIELKAEGWDKTETLTAQISRLLTE